MNRPFRFGVLLSTALGWSDWAARCRRAEESGFDVIAVPDHLPVLAPFAALVAAASVTTRARLATFVLNSAFYSPVLLAREAMTASLLTEGRFELGLGTGYARAEIERAGMSWGNPGKRVDHLATTLVELRVLANQKRPLDWPRPPALPRVTIGGHGDRVLRLAAHYADTVAFSGAITASSGEPRLVDVDAFAERVSFFAAAAGDRAAAIERNVLVQSVMVSDDREQIARAVNRAAPYLSPEAATQTPTLLFGPATHIVETLLHRRDRFGLSSIFVHESAARRLTPIVAALRGQ